MSNNDIGIYLSLVILEQPWYLARQYITNKYINMSGAFILLHHFYFRDYAYLTESNENNIIL